MRYLIGVLCLFSAIAYAQDDREKLMGSWQSQADGVGWVLADKGDALHITRTEAGRTVADFECSSLGKECEIKDDGKNAKVTLYFNGAMLIMLRTRGSDVTKLRFHASGENELVVETTPIVPAGKAETARLTRASTSQ